MFLALQGEHGVTASSAALTPPVWRVVAALLGGAAGAGAGFKSKGIPSGKPCFLKLFSAPTLSRLNHHHFPPFFPYKRKWPARSRSSGNLRASCLKTEVAFADSLAASGCLKMP